MNLAACTTLLTLPENRIWYRAIQPHFWPTALQTSQTTVYPSRFSPASSVNPGFPMLYLGEDHQVALLEVGAVVGSLLPGKPYFSNPRQAWTILNVQVTLHAMADLTLVSEQNRLLTSAQELTGDWECYQYRTAQTSVKQPTGLAPTQLLGRALYGIPGLEGFRSISAKMPTHMNLVVFPDKLLPGSQIVFTYPATGQTFTIP